MATRLRRTSGATGRSGAPGRSGAIAVLAVVAVVLAGCAAPRRAPTYPPAGSTAVPAGSATDAVRTAVTAALGAASLEVADAGQPYRPPEGPWFAAAPRTVVQVKVPGEVEPRFIVLYSFTSASDALAGATDEAAYLANGAGRVQVAIDARITLRVLGPVAVLFLWSPANSEPGARAVETALAGIGTGVPIPG